MPADGVSHSAFWLAAEPLVLASGSVTRRLILQSAGLDPEVRPAAIDERSLEADFARKGLDPAQIAVGLAKAKALSVSCAQPGRVVLGADQTLAIGQGQSREYEQLHKATDLAGVRQTLLKLSGRSHVLHSGIALARDGALLWSHVETARLSVRPLSDAFIDHYIERAGTALLSSVGGYQYEGLGIQLFERIEGDQSTILGLPLLPLLGELRQQGLLLP